MNTIYIGVDFHARQQTICYLTTEDGEVLLHELKHQNKDEVRAFYAQFTGRVIVGLEASGYSPWFEQLLEALGHEVWLGDATEIRRRARWRQKNDRRDAELILDLMIHDEFPRLHRPAPQSREILRMLRYRQKLVKMRTMGKNRLASNGMNGLTILGRMADEKSYFALAEALANREREGVAHWVMRNKTYVGALRSQDGYLILVTLRNASEVISAQDLPKPAGPAPTQKELSMAKHLVSMLEGEFNPADYKDEYRKRVMEFIERKAKGHAPKLRAVRSKRKAGSLDSLLAKSLDALKKGKRAA